MMFSNFSYFVRLSLCLLISIGLHGGVAFYDWAANPPESRLANAPVKVSLRPATAVASPVSDKVSQPAPAPLSQSKKPRSVETKQTVAALKSVTPLPEAKTPKQESQKSSVVERVERAEAEPKIAVAPTEMVCMQPQDAVLDESSATSESSQSVVDSIVTRPTAVAMTNTLPVAIQKIADGLLTDTTSSEELTQAIPSYRSNPLPEYPYQARQKHWEGVVWLLVDVSAAGLVDDLRVEQSCGYRMLDRTASRTVRRWQFTPAKRAGLPVLSQVRIPVRFQLEDD